MLLSNENCLDYKKYSKWLFNYFITWLSSVIDVNGCRDISARAMNLELIIYLIDDITHYRKIKYFIP